jgi:hypothetical protein
MPWWQRSWGFDTLICCRAGAVLPENASVICG